MSMKTGHIYKECVPDLKDGYTRVTCSGDPFRYEYVREDDENGIPHLVQVGKFNRQEEVNSACPESVASIFARAQRGDRSALGDDSGAMYGDFSNFRDLETSYDDYLAFVAAVNAEKAAAAAAVEESVETPVENEVNDNGKS